MIDHVMPQALCPTCGYASDRATGMSMGKGPVVGDLSLCPSCGTLAMFNAGLRLEAVEDEQALLDDMTPAMRRKVELAQQHIKQRGSIRRQETRQ